MSAERSQTWAAAGLLVVALLLAYSNSFQCEFVFDDLVILDNRHIHSFRTLLSAIYPPGPSGGGYTTSGRPLVCASLTANYLLSGTDVWSYHAFNLMVHMLATLTLFGVVRQTLRLPKLSARLEGRSLPLALAAALLWGLHPLQTESVTYTVQRAESLMGLFFLLTLYCVIRGNLAEHPRRWFAAGVCCCALGMASKEVMATAPIMVLLYERVFVFSSWKEIWQQRRNFYALLACTWLLLAAFVLPLGGRGGSAGFGSYLTPWQYLEMQVVAIATYLKLLFIPSPLVLDYGKVLAHGARQVLPSAILLGSLAVGSLLAFRSQPWIGFLGTWFFVILAPSSSFVPVLTQTMAEHRVYLPLAGPIVLLVFIADWLWRRLTRGVAGASQSPLMRGAPAVLLSVVSVLLGVVTWRRNLDYRTALSIWADTVQKAPGNVRAHAALAGNLEKAGQHEAALREISFCIEANPDVAGYYSLRGSFYLNQNRLDEAYADLTKAIEFQPSAGAFQNRGLIYCRRKQFEPAIKDFDQALALDADLLLAYRNRALSHFYLQHFDLARRDIREFRARGGAPDEDLLIVEDFLSRS